MRCMIGAANDCKIDGNIRFLGIRRQQALLTSRYPAVISARSHRAVIGAAAKDQRVAQDFRSGLDAAGRGGNAGDHGRILYIAGIWLRDGNRRVQDPCRGPVFQSRDIFRGMAILGHYRDFQLADLVGDMDVPSCAARIAFTGRAGRSTDTEQASRIENRPARACSLPDVATGVSWPFHPK